MSSPGKEFVVRISILECKDKSLITLISILNSEMLLSFQFQKDLCVLTSCLESPIINPQNSLCGDLATVCQEVMAFLMLGGLPFP